MARLTFSTTGGDLGHGNKRNCSRHEDCASYACLVFWIIRSDVSLPPQKKSWEYARRASEQAACNWEQPAKKDVCAQQSRQDPEKGDMGQREWSTPPKMRAGTLGRRRKYRPEHRSVAKQADIGPG